MSRFDQKQMSADIQLMKTEMKIPIIKPSDDVQGIMNTIMNNKLDGVGIHDLYNYSAKIAVYALYIKGEINSLRAKQDWLESNIKNIVGKNIRNVEGYGYNEKECYIRANDELASQLDEQLINNKAKLNVLYGTDEKLQYIANILQNIAKERSYSRNNM